eukprot:4939534-Amphidinium_carterae.1
MCLARTCKTLELSQSDLASSANMKWPFHKNVNKTDGPMHDAMHVGVVSPFVPCFLLGDDY